MHTTERRGRPATTNARQIAEIAQALFVERGFDETTVEDIAAAAGVNKRTFFRYFASKADVLWIESVNEISRFRALLAEAPEEEPWDDVLCRIAPAAIQYDPENRTWMLHRAQLAFTVPAVREKAAARSDDWRGVATEFVAARRGVGADDLIAIAAGHAAIGALLGAHQYWALHPEEDLTALHERLLRMLLPKV